MPSFQAKIARRLMGFMLSGWAEGSIAEQRARQEKFSRFSRLPKDFERQPVVINGIPAEWFVPASPVGGLILYLHGGAYVLGSIASHREFLTRMAKATQRKILAVEYRLAPEHPFPAALEDALATYHWLLAQGEAPSRIVIAGDSAGGGLAIATLIALRDAGDPLPSGGVCISPWVDLALTGDSIWKKAKADPILTSTGLERSARFYVAENALTNPLISPMYALLTGLPPLLIQVGTEEILEDDSIRLADKARREGVDVTLEDWDGMFHVFPITPFMPESQQALEHIANFIWLITSRATHRNAGQS